MSVLVHSIRPPAPATLVIHMGASAVDSVVRAAVRNYGEYRPLTPDGWGMFAVSVFAVADGITEVEILEALPQRSFARASVGAVTDAGFDLLATSIADADLDPATPRSSTSTATSCFPPSTTLGSPPSTHPPGGSPPWRP